MAQRLGVAVLLLAAASTQVEAGPIRKHARPIAGSYSVVLKQDAARDARDRFSRQPSVLELATEMVDLAGRVGNGFTAITDGQGTNDCNGLGTHVAGTVGGTTYGVAKGVTLHAVRVLGCNGSGTTPGVIQGVDWVTANRVRPAVANMSLGGGASSALDAAINNSIAAGVVYAVAAGNSNADACGRSPARVPAALTAGATTSTDARSSFSNFGTCLDVFAPGSSITSAWSTSITAASTISGTTRVS